MEVSACQLFEKKNDLKEINPTDLAWVPTRPYWGPSPRGSREAAGGWRIDSSLGKRKENVTKSCSIYLSMILIIKSSNVYASMYIWHGRQSEEAFCVQYIWIVY